MEIRSGRVQLLLVFVLAVCMVQAKERRSSAGILPYYIDASGTAQVLIGKERNGMWSDFGGKAEESDSTIQETAVREFGEETRYVFGYHFHKERLAKKGILATKIRLNKEYITPRLGKSFDHPNKQYRMYLAHVDYIPAQVFKRAYKVPDYDKQEYAWVPLEALIDACQRADSRTRATLDGKKIRHHFGSLIKQYSAALRNAAVQQKSSNQCSTCNYCTQAIPLVTE